MIRILAVAAAALAFSVLPLTSAVADECGPLAYCGPPLPAIPGTTETAPVPTQAPEAPKPKPNPHFAATLHGQDTRPCVSKSEFNSVDAGTPRVDVERRWETRSHQTASIPGLGRVDVYKRCGFSMRHAWYGVQYVKGQLHALAWSNDGQTAPTGLLRVS